MARTLSLAFAAGALGGLANSLVAWASGESGLSAWLGVAGAPALTPAWLYPRLVWGGLWGLLFALPLGFRSWATRGLVLSLGPSLVQLLVIFPFRAGKGFFGFGLGAATPALVLAFNAVWGLAASAWMKRVAR